MNVLVGCNDVVFEIKFVPVSPSLGTVTSSDTSSKVFNQENSEILALATFCMALSERYFHCTPSY